MTERVRAILDLAFVTNQELTLAQRALLRKAAGKVPAEIYHLERITTVLDQPAMSAVRKQFLGIEVNDSAVVDVKLTSFADR
jgi:hypothetical protein